MAGMRRLLFFFLVISFYSPTAWGYSSQGPIGTISQNPLYLLFLQVTPESATTLSHGQLRLTSRGTYSNLFEQGASAKTGVALDLDMELFRPSFTLQWGFLPQWEMGIELPFLHFEGGFLDEFIQDYHDFFGFPNAGREFVPNGRFAYVVSQNGLPLYAVGTVPFRPSDIVLHVKRQFLTEEGAMPALAGTFYLKLPTGSKSHGTGSGMLDAGVNVSVQKSYKRLHGYANLGGAILGATNFGLQDFLNTYLWNWMAAVELTAWSHHLGIIAQLQGDGSLFDGTGIPDLDQGNLILTIGLAGQEGPWNWKVAFAEDPSGTGPAVDFTAFFEFSYTWNLP